jgi:hypothetical protein
MRRRSLKINFPRATATGAQATAPIALAIDTQSDDLTAAAATYRGRTLYPTLGATTNLVKLQGASATAAAVEQQAEQANYVTGSGHGQADSFVGQHGDIFRVGHYAPASVAGKIVHLLACDAAAKLGVDFVTNHCRAFFGYDEEFAAWDKPAGVGARFFECDSAIDLGFAQGMTAAQVHASVTKIFQKHINELGALMASEQDQTKKVELEYAIAFLEFDLEHLCSPVVDGKWGDASARL